MSKIRTKDNSHSENTLLRGAQGVNRRSVLGAGIGAILLAPVQAWPFNARTNMPHNDSNPLGYVQVQSGKLELAGQPFAMSGVNYFGSWRFPATFSFGNGYEGETVW